MAVFNPGYESSLKNQFNPVVTRAGTRAPAVDPAGPERPSTLNLAADPPTPAESGIATAGVYHKITKMNLYIIYRFLTRLVHVLYSCSTATARLT
jgi:hypothetical protein